MSNFGVYDLRLVDAYKPSLEEARSAVGGSAVVVESREYPTVAEAIADCELVVGTTAATNRAVRHRLLTVEHAAPEIRAARGRVAILFGNEKTGLDNDSLSYCHFLTRIPAREEHSSMNLGQAVAIVLYELVRGGAPTHTLRKRLPEQDALDRLERTMFEVLTESGYATTNTTGERLRRMFRRLDIPRRDAPIWHGMLRQILWKLRDNKGTPHDESPDDPRPNQTAR
jgi:tRNA/rRNA methyltransferase